MCVPGLGWYPYNPSNHNCSYIFKSFWNLWIHSLSLLFGNSISENILLMRDSFINFQGPNIRILNPHTYALFMIIPNLLSPNWILLAYKNTFQRYHRKCPPLSRKQILTRQSLTQAITDVLQAIWHSAHPPSLTTSRQTVTNYPSMVVIINYMLERCTSSTEKFLS